ncbi:MAG TPA: hypothetical protein VHX88_19795, partial [Solirubrobacteraceae bacterium]|nr:hypothetical protein [Solirubrobacteraceae bacterium]
DARRSRELARRELDLEAIRRPELDELLAAERARRLAFAARLLRNVGAADPAAHAPALAALIDGLVAGAIVDAGAPVMPRSLGAQFETFLRACGGR